MKKGLFVLAFLVASNILVAQTLDDIKKYVVLAKYEEAKTQIDKFLADPKNAAKADGWYYKGVVYNEVSKTNAACTTCKADAFEAFKKYQVMDTKNTWMNEEQNVRLFDLYNGFFDIGAKAYNAKDYTKAFENFKSANDVGSYINSKGFSYNGFSFPVVDTALVLNTALAARLGNNDAEAIKYYGKLASINVNGPDNLEMYQYIVEHYAKSKNMQAFNDAIAQGKKLYPDNEYWIEKELDLVDPKDKKALFAKYEEILATNTTSYAMAYNYAVELFNFTFLADPKPADYDALKAKTKAATAAALKIKNTADANLLMAKTLYNDSYDMQEEVNKIKGAKPEDVKKRNEKKAAVLKVGDECIVYGEAAAAEFAKMEAAEGLKSGQKANYKNCYSLLEGVYGFKGNAAKAAEAKKKGEAIK